MWKSFKTLFMEHTVQNPQRTERKRGGEWEKEREALVWVTVLIWISWASLYMMSPHKFNINDDFYFNGWKKSIFPHFDFLQFKQSNRPRVCLATQNSSANQPWGNSYLDNPPTMWQPNAHISPGLTAHPWMDLLTFSIVSCVCVWVRVRVIMQERHRGGEKWGGISEI